MGKNKLKRFAANQQADNLIEDGKALYTTIKGQWNTVFFKNNQPITVELGCGNGEYTTGLAAAFPDRNFIGTDIKGARLWRGSQTAIEQKLLNAAFLRTRIEYAYEFFENGEIDEIWITFPDPQLKDSREKHRLTHPRFLKLYKTFLQKDGVIHLKTDSRELYEYTLEVLKTEPSEILAATGDLYESEWLADHRGIQTKYERMFLAEGKKINYLKFKLL